MGYKKLDLKFIIFRDRRLFINMSNTFLKVLNIGINEINL